jgi:hypothetical protein
MQPSPVQPASGQRLPCNGIAPLPGADSPQTVVTAEDVQRRIALLRGWCARRLTAVQQAWLDAQIAAIAEDRTALAGASSAAPGQLGTAALALDPREGAAAQELVPGLDAGAWSLADAAAALLALTSFNGDEARFADGLKTALRDGAPSVRAALYRGLALYPAPRRLVPLAADGIRADDPAVFKAVAHHNSYPAQHFTEALWNEMVMKALLIGSRLAPIEGLDERRNPQLAAMLIAHAHERWAARRPVQPELWRCVGPFAAEDYFADLLKAFRSGSGNGRKAAALALSECPTPKALIALETAPTLWYEIRRGLLWWDQIG